MAGKGENAAVNKQNIQTEADKKSELLHLTFKLRLNVKKLHLRPENVRILLYPGARLTLF